MFLNLVMAVSANGFLAKGPKDDMSWTGPEDKALFRLLTSQNTRLLLAGRRTADCMPSLLPDPNRTVMRISRKDGRSLDAAVHALQGGWLLGGPDLAEQALAKRYVKQAILVHNPKAISCTDPQAYGVERLLKYLRDETLFMPASVGQIGELTVRCWDMRLG